MFAPAAAMGRTQRGGKDRRECWNILTRGQQLSGVPTVQSVAAVVCIISLSWSHPRGIGLSWSCAVFFQSRTTPDVMSRSAFTSHSKAYHHPSDFRCAQPRRYSASCRSNREHQVSNTCFPFLSPVQGEELCWITRANIALTEWKLSHLHLEEVEIPGPSQDLPAHP